MSLSRVSSLPIVLRPTLTDLHQIQIIALLYSQKKKQKKKTKFDNDFLKARNVHTVGLHNATCC